MKKKELKIRIDKIGRKWIQATVLFDEITKKVKVHLDENTKEYELNSEVEAIFAVEYEYNKYFRSYDWILKYLEEKKDPAVKYAEEKNAKKQELMKRTEQFLGYIEENINKYEKPYWYMKGHEVVYECVTTLEKKYSSDSDVKEFVEKADKKLEQLQKVYKNAKNEYYDKMEEDFVIYDYNFETAYSKGDIIRGKDKRLYKIVWTGGHFEPDAMSFGGWEMNGQWMYKCKADCRKVTEEDKKAYEDKMAEIEKMAEERFKRKRRHNSLFFF